MDWNIIRFTPYCPMTSPPLHLPYVQPVWNFADTRYLANYLKSAAFHISTCSGNTVRPVAERLAREGHFQWVFITPRYKKNHHILGKVISFIRGPVGRGRRTGRSSKNCNKRWRSQSLLVRLAKRVLVPKQETSVAMSASLKIFVQRPLSHHTRTVPCCAGQVHEKRSLCAESFQRAPPCH